MRSSGPSPYFLVTGLPRSRTAWLADLLSYGRESLCLHEPLRQGAASRPSLRELLNQTSHRYRGLSDCTLGRYAEEIPREARIVVIKRSREDVEQALIRRYGGTSTRALGLLEEELSALESEHTCLVVGFSELSSPLTLARLWRHCLPEVPPDRVRIQELLQLNVQRHGDRA